MQQGQLQQVSQALSSEFSYPFVFVYDFAHILTDGAHDIIAYILHLKELLESGDQQGAVCSFGQQSVHHRLMKK